MPIDTQYYQTYTGQVTEELAFKPAIAKPALSDFFKVVTGVKGKQAVYYIDPVEFVTILDPGCGEGASQLSLNINGEFFEPVDLKIWKWECWKDLRGKVWEWMLNTGNDKNDISTTQYADFMVQAISTGAYNDLVRMAWFADATMQSTALSDANKLKYYKTFNGFWKQAFTAVAGGKSGYVDLSAVNASAAQTADNDLPAGYAIATFKKMWKKMSRELKAQPKQQRQFLVTQSFWDNLLESREDAVEKGIELAYKLLDDGTEILKFRGVTVKVVDEWDIRIASDFTKAGKADLPHRAVLTQFGNLQICFDAQPTNSATDNPLTIWNNIDTEKWNARCLYTADFRIANKGLMVVAY